MYVLSFTQQCLGSPDVVHAVGGTYPNGVEGEAGILLGWTDGRSSTQAIGFSAPGPGRQVVAGTRGWVEVRPRFHRAEELSIHLLGEPAQDLVLPRTGVGYCHEIAHVDDCLAKGLTESPVMPLDDTLAVQKVMAEVLNQLGR